MNKLDKEIKDSIEKNLPNMVAGKLKEYLAQAEEAKEDLEQVRNLYKVSQGINQSLIEQLEVAQTLLDDQATVAVKKAELIILQQNVEAAQRNLDVDTLRTQLAAKELALQSVLDLSRIVFKNTEVKRTVFDTINENVPDPHNRGCNLYSSKSHNINETEVKE